MGGLEVLIIVDIASTPPSLFLLRLNRNSISKSSILYFQLR
jgi:hypothetical protein